MAFTHLHVHTEYSLLDGSNKIKEYVKQLKELGMTSGAITDHGVMYGCIDFYKEALNNGIKPIIGCEVYVSPGSRFDRELGGGDDRYHHLVLLAKNNQGYENLMKIVSAGFTEGFYYKPRVDIEILTQYHEGIIALSACLAGEIPRNLVRGFYDEAKKAALRYLEIFGEGNFYLELQDHGIPEQQTSNAGIMRLNKETGIPLVATNDVHYTYKEDVEPHDILLCLQTGKTLADENRMRYEGGQYYVKSEAEMRELFPYALDAIDNTAKIADMCNVSFTFHETKIPHFDVPDGYTSVTYLRELCEKGFAERFPDDDGTLHDKMDYELSVIEKMGYVDYFLIVWDFINYSRENDIAVGPGRGSAAGSIVSYCLHITNINPVKYQLIFERFLNPDRISMPDIDVDFCFERRQEVIDYVGRKYGADKVAQIVTFGTLAAKGVVRDVSRVMGLPYTFGDNISKMIPNELNITLAKALEMNPDLKKLYNEDEQVKRVIDMSMRLEGLPRHTSMHAAGVLISPRRVDDFVPLSSGGDDTPITTQYTMTTLEELGLLKMDFLGLRTLTVIQNAVRNVEAGKGIKLDMDKIDYADSKVLDYIGTGKTEGIFQLESSGMKSFMKELKPKTLEDVIAGISLYRPGPMDFIPQYIEGKNNPDKITYLCPQLEPILAPTYGCIVYQEQVMQIVRDLGGYTLGRSDEVRRAMSKKKTHVMEQEREYFVYGSKELNIPGCVGNGVPAEVGNKIYDKMIDFAKYAFNKSHAAAYAVVSYQTAFLKYYYPVEYMAALITSVIDNPGKASQYILATRSMGIKILPPDINEGKAGFAVVGDSVRYALNAIKGIGRPIIDAIVKERETNGNYTSLTDFAERCTELGVNKKAVENFIKAGAFDSLGGTRKQYATIFLQVMDDVHRTAKNNISGQISLFDTGEENSLSKETLPNVGEWPSETILGFEKEVLGVYVSGHPLDAYKSMWEKNIDKTTTDFYWDDEVNAPLVLDGSRVTVGGMIADKKIKYNKDNKAMAFLILEDLVGTIEVIVFAKKYEQFSRFLTDDAKIFVTGRVSTEDNKDAKLIAENIFPFSNVPRTLWLRFDNKAKFDELFPMVKEATKESEGADRIVIYLNEEKQMKRLSDNQNISASEEMLAKLGEIIGEQNVVLKCD